MSRLFLSHTLRLLICRQDTHRQSRPLTVATYLAGVDNDLLNVESARPAPIWKELDPVFHFLHDGLLQGAVASTDSSDSILAAPVAVDCLLDLFVRHAGPWQHWSCQRLVQIRYVDGGHDEQRAHAVPHVVFLVELSL